MTPTSTPAAPSSGVSTAPAHPAGGGKGSHGGGGAVPGLTADVTDGQAQAKALGPIGIPIYYPRLLVSGSQYCSS